jgi:Right handed beta helix region
MSRALSLALSLAVVTASLMVVAARQPAAAQTCSVHVHPWNDVQNVIDHQPQGAVVCFAKGVYRIRTPLVPKAHMHLVGARGAILSGAKRLTSFIKKNGFWVATDQHQQQTVGDERCMPATYTGCRYAEGVYVGGRALRQVMSRGALGPGRFFFDYASDEIWLGSNPSGKDVETSIAPAAIVGYGRQQPGVVVRGFVVQMFASPPTGLPAAIKPGNGWLITRNTIRLNHRLGVYANPGVRIVHNNIHDNGLAGIRGEGNGIRVVGNHIEHNNIERYSEWYSAGARFTSTDGLVVRHNVVARNLGPGIKTDTNNIHVLVERNRVIGNTGPGIAHEKGYRARIVGNYLRNNALATKGKSIAFGAQIMLNASSDTVIAHNRVICTVHVNAIGLRHDNRGSGAYGVFAIKHDVVHDNVIRMRRGSEFGLSSVDPDAFTSWGNRFYGNTYYLRHKRNHFYAWKSSLLGVSGWRSNGNDMDGTFLNF